MTSAIKNQEPLSRLAQIDKIKDATVAAMRSAANQRLPMGSFALYFFIVAAFTFVFLAVLICTNFFPEIYAVQTQGKTPWDINVMLALCVLLCGWVTMLFANSWLIITKDKKNPSAKAAALQTLLKNYIPLESVGYKNLQVQAREHGHVNLVQALSWIEDEKQAVKSLELIVPLAPFNKQSPAHYQSQIPVKNNFPKGILKISSFTKDQVFLSKSTQINAIYDAARKVKEMIGSNKGPNWFATVGAILFGAICLGSIYNGFVTENFFENSFFAVVFGVLFIVYFVQWYISFNDRRNPYVKIQALQTLIENCTWSNSTGYRDLRDDIRTSGHIDLMKVFSWIEAEKEALKNLELTVPCAPFEKHAT